MIRCSRNDRWPCRTDSSTAMGLFVDDFATAVEAVGVSLPDAGWVSPDVGSMTKRFRFSASCARRMPASRVFRFLLDRHFSFPQRQSVVIPIHSRPAKAAKGARVPPNGLPPIHPDLPASGRTRSPRTMAKPVAGMARINCPRSVIAIPAVSFAYQQRVDVLRQPALGLIGPGKRPRVWIRHPQRCIGRRQR